MGKSKAPTPIYFMTLELENVRCFGKGQALDLTDDSGGPAQWTLILGENGVGKTTLLQCLAWMRPVPQGEPESKPGQAEGEFDDPPPLVKGSLGPSLPNEVNKVLEGLLRIGSRLDLVLKAELCQNRNFNKIFTPDSPGKKPALDQQAKTIKTGVVISYSRKRMLEEVKPKGNTRIQTLGEFQEPLIVAYGANRRLGRQNLAQSDLDDPIASRLSGVTELYDAEEILLNLDHATLRNGSDSREGIRLKKVKNFLAKILPDIESSDDIEISAPNILDDYAESSGVRFKTFSGYVPLSALSLGYQTTLAWTVDLAFRLFRHYPGSSDPLDEPAVVLIDEVDLHLHPIWQLTIIDDLTQLFTRTQFIATAHSPLMVQVAQTANLAVVRKRSGEVEIVNDPAVVRSWRVDQILTSKLFGVPYARNKQTELLFKERDDLLDKPVRSPTEESRLSNLEHQIASLPTAQNPEDQQAMELIREAASLLKKHKKH